VQLHSTIWVKATKSSNLKLAKPELARFARHWFCPNPRSPEFLINLRVQTTARSPPNPKHSCSKRESSGLRQQISCFDRQYSRFKRDVSHLKQQTSCFKRQNFCFKRERPGFKQQISCFKQHHSLFNPGLSRAK